MADLCVLEILRKVRRSVREKWEMRQKRVMYSANLKRLARKESEDPNWRGMESGSDSITESSTSIFGFLPTCGSGCYASKFSGTDGTMRDAISSMGSCFGGRMPFWQFIINLPAIKSWSLVKLLTGLASFQI